MARRFREELGRGSKAERAYDTLRELGAGEDLEELLEFANEITRFPEGHLSNLVEESLRAGVKSDSGKAIGGYKRKRNKIIRDVNVFRERLFDWITQVCMAFDKVASVELYGTFVERLASHGYPVFTTNYDGVFEFVARQKGINIVDNFTRQGNRYFWDETLSSFQGNGLRLIKIHGSIYWHADNHSRIERIDPPAPYNSDGEEVERLLIVPTRFKDIYSRNYFPLYTSFLRSLGAAESLLVIGHSLRDEYLLAAIRDRLRDESFTIMVVDPELPMRPQLEGGARNPDKQIVHIPQRAQEVTGLLNQLANGKPSGERIGVARNAASAIQRGVLPRIEIKERDPWLAAGKSHSIPIRIRTTKVPVLLDGWIDVDKKADRRRSLREQIHRAWGDRPTILGFQEVQRSIRVYLGKSLGTGPHRMTFVLRHKEQDAVVAKESKDFRLKGATE